MAGIYIHIPFCKQACHYCNFYFSTSTRYKSELIAAIIKEIELTREYLNSETVETIYIGGGTPSLLEAGEVNQIVAAIYRYHHVSLREFTLEANPDDLTAAKVKDLKTLRSIGLNRLSIGVQSFQEADLSYMNRAHTAEEASEAIKRAQDAQFENLTIDLIYGTPTMTDEGWAKNLAQTLALGIPHISAYSLTVEPKTTLDINIKKGKAAPVDEVKSARQFDQLIETMQERGYEQYEISNYALPARYAIHNTNYWMGKRYLGLGPSAHSFNLKSRQWNVANLQAYLKSIALSQLPKTVEHLTPVQQLNEYMMTALRTIWGCDINRLGNYREAVMNELKKIDTSLYLMESGTITLTQAGKHYADGIAAQLFVEE